MADQLNSDTQNRIRDLCKKISVAHDLDNEIQEELYGHMEDKLLAYLNGEEPVTEDDALILVREHFGDPAVLKGLMQDVHAEDVHTSLARRLAVAAIATSGATALCVAITRFVFQFWEAPRGFGVFLACLAVITATTVVVPWLLLSHWQRQLSAGRALWFIRWQPAYLMGLAAAFMILQLLMNPMMLLQNHLPTRVWSAYTVLLIRWIPTLVPLLQCVVWIWWCNRTPRIPRTVWKTAAAWVLWAWSVSLYGVLERGVGITSFLLHYRIGLRVGISLLWLTVCAYIACLVYRLARQTRRRYVVRALGGAGDD